jgi:predicted nucleic acid-binding Zn ribbon protein
LTSANFRSHANLRVSRARRHDHRADLQDQRSSRLRHARRRPRGHAHHFGGAGLLFKGSGFYITDYGKDGKKDQRAAAGGESGSKGATSSKSSDSASGSASSTKSDSKPAASPAASSTKSD